MIELYRDAIEYMVVGMPDDIVMNKYKIIETLERSEFFKYFEDFADMQYKRISSLIPRDFQFSGTPVLNLSGQIIGIDHVLKKRLNEWVEHIVEAYTKVNPGTIDEFCDMIRDIVSVQLAKYKSMNEKITDITDSCFLDEDHPDGYSEFYCVCVVCMSNNLYSMHRVHITSLDFVKILCGRYDSLYSDYTNHKTTMKSYRAILDCMH